MEEIDLKVDKKTLDELEFSSVIEALKSKTFSEYGKIYFDLPSFDEDPVMIYERVRETMDNFHDISSAISRVSDVTEALKTAKDGNSLEASDIIAFSELFRVTEKLAAALENSYTMKNMVEILLPPKGFLEMCDKTFAPDGTLKDSATKELQHIRKELKAIERTLDERIKKLLADGTKTGVITDALVLQRHDRYVLPIDSTKRGAVKGIIHGQSASGATYYVEPEELIELNDTLAITKSKESIEIARILSALTRRISDNHEKISGLVETLEEFDAIYARALYGIKNDCVIPAIRDDGAVRIIAGRNPLIPERKVIPIDFEMETEDRVIVISGPNTGGKTASLKTLGLFVLMTSLGIPLPARAGTEITLFDAIRSDIGDNQSVKDELSTFSARVIRESEICRMATKKSLVIVDEIGDGTEPSEGAAFAKSVLEILMEKGAHSVVTTHYPELKSLAFTTPGVRNASVGFDVEKMEPTYRIHMDMPGRSRALEIVEKLKVFEDLVGKFKINRSATFSQSDLLIEELQTKIRNYEEKLNGLKDRETALEKREEEFDGKFEKLKSGKVESLSEELKSLSEELSSMKREAEEAIHAVRSSGDANRLSEQNKRLEELRRRAEKTVVHGGKKTSVNGMQVSVGDHVEVIGAGTRGRITDVKKDRVVVDLGNVRVEISPENIRKVTARETANVSFEYARNESVPTQIDVRGMVVEDAVAIVEEFADRVIQSNSIGYIIHGKGTGRLANGIWAFLRTKRIHFRIGKQSEGGTGVTVIGDEK